MKIPPGNLYYLLCYAWDVLEARHLVDVEVLQARTPLDLFAKVLTEGLYQLLRRGGLHRGYHTFDEDTSRPRGRILMGSVVKRRGNLGSRLPCRLDELTTDVLHNRILKATLRRLRRAEGLDRKLVRDLATLEATLHDVSDEPITPASFRRVVLHRNNVAYALLLHVCELVHRCLLPRETGDGRLRFRDFTGDDRQMGELFEKFVQNFLRREQSAWRIGRRTLPWAATAPDPRDMDWLPGLETDVMLLAPGRRLVIECKCVDPPRNPGRYGKRTLRSDHLYQLHAYLTNLAERHRDEEIEGLLLYATVGESFAHEYAMGGRRVRVAALDVGQEWREVRRGLLRYIDLQDPAFA